MIHDNDPAPRRPARPARPSRPMVSFTAASLKGVVFPPPKWVVDDLMPDGLTLLGGRPKVGKSYLVLDICIAVASGGWVLERRCMQGDVLYAALEDSAVRLQRRLEQLTDGGDFPERLTLATDMDSLDGECEAQLREWIASVEDPRLIVIDVFKLVRPEGQAGERPYDYDYRSVTPLKQLALETGVPICLIHHQRKEGSDTDVLDTISGSTGLTGSVDTILVLDRKNGGEVLYARGRDIEELEWAVRRDPRTGKWAYQGQAAEVRMSDERRRVIEALKEDGEPLTATATAELLGITGDYARKLLSRMAEAGLLSRARRGQYTLP